MNRTNNEQPRCEVTPYIAEAKGGKWVGGNPTCKWCKQPIKRGDYHKPTRPFRPCDEDIVAHLREADGLGFSADWPSPLRRSLLVDAADKIERLQKDDDLLRDRMVAELRAEVEKWEAAHANVVAQRDDRDAEVERLRATVQRVEDALEGQWEYGPHEGVSVQRLRVALDG